MADVELPRSMLQGSFDRSHPKHPAFLNLRIFEPTEPHLAIAAATVFIE